MINKIQFPKGEPSFPENTRNSKYSPDSSGNLGSFLLAFQVGLHAVPPHPVVAFTVDLRQPSMADHPRQHSDSVGKTVTLKSSISFNGTYFPNLAIS